MIFLFLYDSRVIFSRERSKVSTYRGESRLNKKKYWRYCAKRADNALVTFPKHMLTFFTSMEQVVGPDKCIHLLLLLSANIRNPWWNTFCSWQGLQSTYTMYNGGCRKFADVCCMDGSTATPRSMMTSVTQGSRLFCGKITFINIWPASRKCQKTLLKCFKSVSKPG